MPDRLGRYRIVRTISTGGMARVYEARREAIEGVAPRVALKVILPQHAQDQAYRQMFINEARIGSMLRHQNLCQVQDFDASDEGLFFLVMEYVEGVTLRQSVRQARRQGALIPLSIIAEIGRQVCDGLHHAHSARSPEGHHLQLVHRDLKPSNLMLNPQGVVKLLDFGISKAQITDERSGAIRGTWGYMAPEQAAGEPVGASADLFGLASVLYELAALQPLFSEKDPATVRELLAQDEAARRASRLT
ncbi:MAG: serine/threonine protein kinase, partial [Myxococcota bacterium]